ncbi:pentaheme c-type cytochrome TorC [Rhodopseudomonas palustris]|uniref:Cytochrome c-type protein n=1 Tax=Rhodopseudomonas palustris (strain BisB18) TaxID=316056 RepID=Q217X8_RHOPB
MIQFLRSRGSKWTLALVAVAGAVAGVIGWGGFNTAMEATNSLEFCISCHEMRDTVFKEYQKSIHYTNASGVRAACPDCHVPKQWLPKFIRKVEASSEIYHKLVGTIDTPEKFEAARLGLAKRVWATMKNTDSRECRNCHSFQTMDFHKQRPAASEAMQKGMADGKTCIDCHKGIAHKMPDMSVGYRSIFNELAASAKTLQPKVGDTLATLITTSFYLDKPGKDDPADGRLLAATPMKVTAVDGPLLQVQLTGWQQEGSEQMLYARQGKRIPSAALGPEAVEKVTSVSTMTDPDTDQVWSEGKLAVWVKNENLVADAAKLNAYGAEMYSSSCGLCHALPATGHFLANQWIGNLNAMKRFVTLDDEQFRMVQKYVQMNAQDTGGKHE